MKLWTLQPLEVAHQIQRYGIATAHPEFDLHWGQSSSDPWGFRQAYTWMSAQMSQRIGPPPPGTSYPMWAWARAPHRTRRGAPDLRFMRENHPGVLLELDVDTTDILLSDHADWHHVLNGWALSCSESEHTETEKCLRALCANLGSPMGKHGILNGTHFARPEIRDFLEKTWHRIFRCSPFDMKTEISLPSPRFAPPSEMQALTDDDSCVQACLWSIRKNQIVSSTPYVPRKPRGVSL